MDNDITLGDGDPEQEAFDKLFDDEPDGWVIIDLGTATMVRGPYATEHAAETVREAMDDPAGYVSAPYWF